MKPARCETEIFDRFVHTGAHETVCPVRAYKKTSLRHASCACRNDLAAGSEGHFASFQFHAIRMLSDLSYFPAPVELGGGSQFHDFRQLVLEIGLILQDEAGPARNFQLRVPAPQVLELLAIDAIPGVAASIGYVVKPMTTHPERVKNARHLGVDAAHPGQTVSRRPALEERDFMARFSQHGGHCESDRTAAHH